MTNLIPSENFKVVSAKGIILKKTKYITEIMRGGYAIRDLRNGKLVSMNDEYFFCIKTKKTVVHAIKDGLYDGFTWFDDSVLGRD